MIEMVKKYLRSHKIVERRSYICNGEEIESQVQAWTTKRCIIRCYGPKKKLLLYKELNDIDLCQYSEMIFRSKMVIVRANVEYRNIVITQLGAVCNFRKCYAPIVYAETGDVLFFPELRYQDSYLIKSILEKSFRDWNFQVVYGNKNVVVI